MERTKTVYLSLGSNLGDRAANIAAAIEALAAAGLRITRQSSLYATEPVGFRPQRWFLNCVLEAETGRMPRLLLHLMQDVERRLGRRRMVSAAADLPRVMDIDILLFGTSRIRTAELEVPHPRMAARRFVLVPLAEIAPGLRHPALQRTIAELLAETRDRSRVTPWRSGQEKGEGEQGTGEPSIVSGVSDT